MDGSPIGLGAGRRALAIAFAASLCAGAAPAHAFDTGPHADMTRDALTSEGATPASATIAAANNWFVDYYTNPDRNPHSGHASFLLGWTRLGLSHETWPQFWVTGARRLHFDYEQRAIDMPNLSSTPGIEKEWDRLEYRARRLLGIYGRANDPLGVLATIGSSLHAVQDFYSHSNWVEAVRPDGMGGPGVASLGYGSHPTFFDVPPEVRRDVLVGDRRVYTGVPGAPREHHGHWRSHYLPFNPFLPTRPRFEEALNKDWPGRPGFQDAYITAYFATRQWLRALRTWLGNEPLWQRAMSMPQTRALSHDFTGAEEISQYSGHWQGGGEPCVRFINCSVRSGKAGSLSSLTIALRDFHAGPTSPYRRAFNRMIGEWALFAENIPGGKIPDFPDLPSSRTIQALTRFVKLEVVNYRGIGLGDTIGDADIYTNVRMRGQPSTSTIIDGEDSFSFRLPYAPFTWIRSVPMPNQASTPVTSMVVRVETGNRSGAGTDDDVFLRINGNHRFSLDKRLYDDFERGDVDTYSVPIGTADPRRAHRGGHRPRGDREEPGRAQRVLVPARGDAGRQWPGRPHQPGDRPLAPGLHPDVRGAGIRARRSHQRRRSDLAAAARGRLRPPGDRGHQPIRPAHLPADLLPDGHRRAATRTWRRAPARAAAAPERRPRPADVPTQHARGHPAAAPRVVSPASAAGSAAAAAGAGGGARPRLHGDDLRHVHGAQQRSARRGAVPRQRGQGIGHAGLRLPGARQGRVGAADLQRGLRVA